MSQQSNVTTDTSTVRNLAFAVLNAVADQIDTTVAAVDLPKGTVVSVGGHQYMHTGRSLAFPWQSPTNTELYSDGVITHVVANGEDILKGPA